jgi:leucyl aminopeptidase
LVQLLPPQRDVRIARLRADLSERELRKHDLIIIACEPESASTQLARLPFARLWERLYRERRSRGPVALLKADVTEDSIPVVVLFPKRAASRFELLSLAGRAWKEANNGSVRRVLLATRAHNATQEDALLEALLAATLAGSARLPTLKSKPPRTPPLEQITLSSGAKLDTRRTIAVDRGNHLARWLTTLPPNVLNARSYRNALRDLARQRRWEFKFYDEAALKRLGAGAFLAVSRANDRRDAGIVRLRYRPRRRSSATPHLTLVGKGICFDTGGINLKPHKSMYLMHEDMQGSAVALGTLSALAELEAGYDIDCWLAITENEIGPRAYRPQEVVTAANGTTIQVAHSDAEGRMVLADTLALASREEPDLILDFATLTGSCVAALTERYSGAFTNRPDWHATLQLAGRDSGERVWPFPMDEDYDSDLESSVADILQCTPDSKGDHILAARFLNRFVPPEIPWVHIDLSSSTRSGGLAHIPSEFTGFGVRYATHLVMDYGLLGGKRKRPTGQLAAGKRDRIR